MNNYPGNGFCSFSVPGVLPDKLPFLGLLLRRAYGCLPPQMLQIWNRFYMFRRKIDTKCKLFKYCHVNGGSKLNFSLCFDYEKMSFRKNKQTFSKVEVARRETAVSPTI